MIDGTTIFLAYSRLPHFAERGYEDWLRTHDNPFFNSIPGIGRYENWKLAEPGGTLGFDYFDLVHLDGTRDLEAVWFDAELTAFRRNWVALWGYGGTPSAVNGQGYLMTGPIMPPLCAEAARLAFAPDAASSDPTFTIVATMPKHYAWPEDRIPQPWQAPVGPDLPLPAATLSVGEAPGGIEIIRIAP